MTFWLLFKRWIISRFAHLNGRMLGLVVLAYGVIGWLLLYGAGETAMTQSLSRYVYYLIVTASTVGYGDYSPVTEWGQWITSFWIIPGGLGLFAVVIGHVTGSLVDYWRRGLQGKRSIRVKNHLLILGWNGQRTIQLIRLLQSGVHGERPIVLCARAEIENPLPGEVEFVRVASFTDAEGIARAKVEHASSIIIDNPEDDITLSAALFCAHKNPSAHLLAYFQDDAISQILKQHYPHAECVPSVSVEMLAKAAVDPGSSQLHHELLSTSQGMTQYCARYPSNATEIDTGDLFGQLKQEYDATLIGIDQGQGIILNPPMGTKVLPGDRLFYIAAQRLPHWSAA